MKYKDARRLQNEDEVTVKKTKCILRVVSVENISSKDTYLMLEDGNWYHHTELV